jgi:hypothetical protein
MFGDSIMNSRRFIMAKKKSVMILAPEALPEHMDGDTLLEKQLNAYLTDTFVQSYDVPPDECLSEAKEIIAILRRYKELN